jgi:glutamate-1-semialdehyde 2,1-aminomutase
VAVTVEPSMPGRTVELVARAEGLFPGGVNSPVRAFRSVERRQLVLERGSGPYVWDADGRRYLDYIGAWGAAVLGHAEPRVVAAIGDAVRDGLALGATHPREIALGGRSGGRCRRSSGCGSPPPAPRR